MCIAFTPDRFLVFHLQYCRVPKNGQAGVFLKIRTTRAGKLSSELHANNVCCEDDFFSGIADFETTPRRRVETFQPVILVSLSFVPLVVVHVLSDTPSYQIHSNLFIYLFFFLLQP